MAEGHGVPPFVIFADTTLRDLARRRPTTTTNFRQIHGVGDKKTADFGTLFTDAIRDYCSEQKLSVDVMGADTAAGSSAPAKPQQSAVTSDVAVSLSASKQLAFDLFREGKSIDHVATTTARSPSTISDYLSEFIAITQQCDPAPWVNESVFQRIREAARTVGIERMKPIFEALGETVTYDQIRVALACMRNLPPVG